MKNSYVVLEEAAKKIKQLTTEMNNFTSSNYRHEVSDILKHILKENSYEISDSLTLVPGFLKSDECEDNVRLLSYAILSVSV